MQCIFQSHMLLFYLCIEYVCILISLLRIIESCLCMHLTYIQCHICMYMWDVCSVSKMYVYIYIQRCMYTCIYMLARCIYTGIEPLVWRVCVHVSHVSHVSRSRSLACARALSLPLSLSIFFVLWCFSLLFQERTCKRWALSHDATSVYNNLCVRMQHIKSIKYEPQHKTRSLSRALSLSLKKMLYSTRLQVQERPPDDTQLE